MVRDHLTVASKTMVGALSCSLLERGCMVVLELTQGDHASGVIGVGDKHLTVHLVKRGYW